MGTPSNHAEVAVSFGVVAQEFCSLVDSESDIDRSEFVVGVYRILPKLISGAIEMPVVQSHNQRRRSPLDVRYHEWERRYNAPEREAWRLEPVSAGIRSNSRQRRILRKPGG